jgi:hypothetical protein
MSSINIDSISTVAERQFDKKQKRINELQESRQDINISINNLLHCINGLSDLVKNGIMIIHLPSVSSLFKAMRYISEAHEVHKELFDVLIDKEAFEKNGYHVELRESSDFSYNIEYQPCLIITTKKATTLYKLKLWFCDFSVNCIRHNINS